MSRRAWGTWALLVVSALGLQAWALWGERWGVAENPAAARNWPVGEIAEGITAEQSFVMRVPGLRSFTFTPRPVGDTVVGDVIVDVLDVTPEGDRSLFRVIKKATAVVRGGRPYTLEFSPIDLPVPRTFKVRIALPDARFGQGFFIDGVEHDRYPGGVLLVNNKEVWGDLVFETDAAAAHLAGRVGSMLQAYPRALRSLPVLVALGLLLNVVLAWTLRVAVAGEPASASRAARADAGALVVARVWRWAVANRAFAVTALALLAVVVAAAGGRRGRVLVDLAESFPRAEARTSLPSLHQGFAVFDFPTVGVLEPCILALPSSRITWSLDSLPPNAMLTVRAGIRPDAWEVNGDGAVFRVAVVSGRGYEELRRLYLNPHWQVEDRGYRWLRFDLARFLGAPIKIVLSVDPGPANNAVNDAALWCAPRIVSN